MPTTNFWYDEKAGGGAACAWAGGGAAVSGGEAGTGTETESLLMKSLSCPEAWMNARPNGSPRSGSGVKVERLKTPGAAYARPGWVTPLKNNIERFLRKTSSMQTGDLSTWRDRTTPTLN
jgi:hypothetical protein